MVFAVPSPLMSPSLRLRNSKQDIATGGRSIPLKQVHPRFTDATSDIPGCV